LYTEENKNRTNQKIHSLVILYIPFKNPNVLMHVKHYFGKPNPAPE